MPFGSMHVDALGPWIEYALGAFGVDRCFFGSNFPVDAVYGTFDELYTTFSDLTAGLDEASRAKLFAESAERIYRILSGRGGRPAIRSEWRAIAHSCFCQKVALPAPTLESHHVVHRDPSAPFTAAFPTIDRTQVRAERARGGLQAARQPEAVTPVLGAHDGQHLPGLPRRFGADGELPPAGQATCCAATAVRKRAPRCGTQCLVLPNPLGVPDLRFVTLVAVWLVRRHAPEERAVGGHFAGQGTSNVSVRYASAAGRAASAQLVRRASAIGTLRRRILPSSTASKPSFGANESEDDRRRHGVARPQGH